MTFSPKQRKFIEWVATPKSDRDPPTYEEFATQLGITSRTLRNWRNLPGFWEEVWHLAEMHLGDRLAGIYKALADKAEAGNVSAIRLALEATGKINPQTNIQQVNVAPFTIEELNAARKASQTWDHNFEHTFSENTETTETDEPPPAIPDRTA